MISLFLHEDGRVEFVEETPERRAHGEAPRSALPEDAEPLHWYDEQGNVIDEDEAADA